MSMHILKQLVMGIYNHSAAALFLFLNPTPRPIPTPILMTATEIKQTIIVVRRRFFNDLLIFDSDISRGAMGGSGVFVTASGKDLS